MTNDNNKATVKNKDLIPILSRRFSGVRSRRPILLRASQMATSNGGN